MWWMHCLRMMRRSTSWKRLYRSIRKLRVIRKVVRIMMMELMRLGDSWHYWEQLPLVIKRLWWMNQNQMRQKRRVRMRYYSVPSNSNHLIHK